MPGHSNKESRRTNLRSVPGWALNESFLTGRSMSFVRNDPYLPREFRPLGGDPELRLVDWLQTSADLRAAAAQCVVNSQDGRNTSGVTTLNLLVTFQVFREASLLLNS